MNTRPYLCGKCGNWYSPHPPMDGSPCRFCVTGTHTPHIKTGVVDCHFGEKSSHPSERRMAEIVTRVETINTSLSKASAGILQASVMGEVTDIMTLAERDFAAAEKMEKEIPEILRWAGVMELPGLVDADANQRFKNIDAMQELVKQKRRPPEDLEELVRSTKLVTMMADEVPSLMASIRIAIGQVRQAGMKWQAPVREYELSMTPRAVKQREKRAAQKEEAAAV